MKKEYKLIALDMDGTLLNSEKKISQKNQQAIAKASKEGKIVILNTGRGPAELEEFYHQLPTVQYLNCLSGGLVYDRFNHKKIYTQSLSIETVFAIIDMIKNVDCMPQFLTDLSIVQKDHIAKMAHFHMEAYQEMFERVATPCENLFEDYRKNPYEVAKININHVSIQERDATKQRIIEMNLDVEVFYGEGASLEISPKNVNKGNGLKALCHYLDIDLDNVIVVGDGDNDREAFSVAGFKVAMNNASDEIKNICDKIVSDNDHDGCKEAIEQYLLA